MVKKNLGRGRVDIEKGQPVDEPPDVQTMYDSAYKGKTKRLWNQDRGVLEIRDVPQDPYKGVRSTKKHEESSVDGGNPLNIETNFDRKAYKEMED